MCTVTSDSSLSRFFDRSGNRYCPTTGGSVGECASPLGDCRGSIARAEWRDGVSGGRWQTEVLSLEPSGGEGVAGDMPPSPEL